MLTHFSGTICTAITGLAWAKEPTPGKTLAPMFQMVWATSKMILSPIQVTSLEEKKKRIFKKKFLYQLWLRSRNALLPMTNKEGGNLRDFSLCSCHSSPSIKRKSFVFYVKLYIWMFVIRKRWGSLSTYTIMSCTQATRRVLIAFYLLKYLFIKSQDTDSKDSATYSAISRPSQVLHGKSIYNL